MELLNKVQEEAITVTPSDLAPLFKALAHPKRMAILEALREGERCVCELEEDLGLRRSQRLPAANGASRGGFGLLPEGRVERL